MLTVTVKTSLRYISTGSAEPFSPMPNAAEGVAGVRIASTPSANTVSKSRLIKRADFLRAHIIGVVVAGRQHIGADHQAPPHLRAEARGARLLVEVGDVRAGLAQAVAHAVVAREIARRLRGRDDIIGGQARGACCGSETSTMLRARRAQPFGAARPQRLDLRRHAVEPVFPGDADRQALHRAADRRLVIGNGRDRRRSNPWGPRPAIERSMIAASRTVRAIGPA